MAERLLLQAVGLAVVLLIILIASCGAPVGPNDRVTAGGALVRRVRFEEDKVTCYVVGTNNGVSCLRDQP